MDQLNIYDLLFPKYKIKKPIRLIELFAGIGSQAKALERLGANFEHYRVIEFDRYAINSYNNIHGTNFETSDITKVNASDLEIVDTDKYDYIMTYSFPCQDLSLAGKRKGMKKGSGTRSGLLWEVERILDECEELPQILLMENVPQVLSSENFNDFMKWQQKLEKLGYTNYVSLLNSKDYGIPQNRNRCFMVSILGQYNYSFPKPIELKLRLKDMLEYDVDEKFYLSKYQIDKINESIYTQYKRRIQEKDLCDTLCARDYKDPKCVEVFDYRYDEGVRGRVDKNISPTLTTKTGSSGISGQPLLKIPEATKKGYKEAYEGDGVYINRPHQKRGVVQNGMIQTLKTQCDDVGVVVGTYQYSKSEKFMNGKDRFNEGKDIVDTIQTLPKEAIFIKDKPICIGNVSKGNSEDGNVYSKDGLSQTLCAGTHGYAMGNIQNNLRIRKLTPLECWRLMGFDDDDFYKAKNSNSNSQLYKQAGNSIVVDVLYYIFKEFLI